MRILVLCTGNRCRSQMAEAILHNINPTLEVYSAGTKPANAIHPLAIKVLAEIGIDLSKNYPKHVDQFVDKSWDYVITVCGGAKETCPVFTGKVGKRLHIGFDDPDGFKGDDAQILKEFYRVRDEIKTKMEQFYQKEIKGID